MLFKHSLRIFNDPDGLGNINNPAIWALRTGSAIGFNVAEAAIGNAVLATTSLRATAGITDVQALQAVAVGAAIWGGIPFFLEAFCCASRDRTYNFNEGDSESRDWLFETDPLTHIAGLIIGIETGAAVLKFVPNAPNTTTSQYLAANASVGAAVMYVGLHVFVLLLVLLVSMLQIENGKCCTLSFCDLEKIFEAISSCCRSMQECCNPKPLLSMFNCYARKRTPSNNTSPISSAANQPQNREPEIPQATIAEAGPNHNVITALPVDPESLRPVQIIYVYTNAPPGAAAGPSAPLEEIVRQAASQMQDSAQLTGPQVNSGSPAEIAAPALAQETSKMQLSLT